MEYKVKTYKQMLLDENQRQNLVSRRNPENEVEKHILDSLAILTFMSISGKSLIDIGSGAGFPGMVLALAVDECKITLLESDHKKADFLIRVKEVLKLENVNVIVKRAEEIGHEERHREKYDLCTSRAVAPIRVLLEYCIPLITLQGKVVMWKGRNYANEISEAGNAMEKMNAQISCVHSYNLMDEFDRTLVVVEKGWSTSQQYPRRVGIPMKRPL